MIGKDSRFGYVCDSDSEDEDEQEVGYTPRLAPGESAESHLYHKMLDTMGCTPDQLSPDDFSEMWRAMQAHMGDTSMDEQAMAQLTPEEAKVYQAKVYHSALAAAMGTLSKTLPNEQARKLLAQASNQHLMAEAARACGVARDPEGASKRVMDMLSQRFQAGGTLSGSDVAAAALADMAASDQVSESAAQKARSDLLFHEAYNSDPSLLAPTAPASVATQMTVNAVLQGPAPYADIGRASLHARHAKLDKRSGFELPFGMAARRRGAPKDPWLSVIGMAADGVSYLCDATPPKAKHWRDQRTLVLPADDATELRFDPMATQPVWLAENFCHALRAEGFDPNKLRMVRLWPWVRGADPFREVPKVAAKMGPGWSTAYAWAIGSTSRREATWDTNQVFNIDLLAVETALLVSPTGELIDLSGGESCHVNTPAGELPGMRLVVLEDAINLPDSQARWNNMQAAFQFGQMGDFGYTNQVVVHAMRADQGLDPRNAVHRRRHRQLVSLETRTMVKGYESHEQEEHQVAVTREFANKFVPAWEAAIASGRINKPFFHPDGTMHMMLAPHPGRALLKQKPILKSYKCQHAPCGILSSKPHRCSVTGRNYCGRMCQACDWYEGGASKLPRPPPTPPSSSPSPSPSPSSSDDDDDEVGARPVECGVARAKSSAEARLDAIIDGSGRNVCKPCCPEDAKKPRKPHRKGWSKHELDAAKAAEKAERKAATAASQAELKRRHDERVEREQAEARARELERRAAVLAQRIAALDAPDKPYTVTLPQVPKSDKKGKKGRKLSAKQEEERQRVHAVHTSAEQKALRQRYFDLKQQQEHLAAEARKAREYADALAEKEKQVQREHAAKTHHVPGEPTLNGVLDDALKKAEQ